jgi:hypothetical protein
MTSKSKNVQTAAMHNQIRKKLDKQNSEKNLKNLENENLLAVQHLTAHHLEPISTGASICTPTLFPSKSAPIKKSIALTREADNNEFGAFMITADPDMCYWEWLFVEDTAPQTIIDDTVRYYTWPNSSVSASLGMWFSLSNGHSWKPTAIGALGYEACHSATTREANPQAISNALFYYPGTLTFFNATTFTCVLTSQQVAVSGSFIIGEYTGAGVSPVLTGSYNLATGTSTVTIPISGTKDVVNPVFYLTNAGAYDYIQLTADFNFPLNATVGDAWTIKPNSLFDLMGADAIILQKQFEVAAQWKPVSTSIRFMQPTTLLRLGGSVSAAQLPGGSVHSIPSDPSSLYDFLGGRQDLSYKAQSFRRGIHASLVPERLQNFEFRRKARESAATRFETFDFPFIVVAYQKIANDNGDFTDFVLAGQLNIAYELKSTDLSLTLSEPLCIPWKVYQYIIARMMTLPNIGENPDHIKRIRGIIKQIINDPTVRKHARNAAKTGISWLGKAALASAPILL